MSAIGESPRLARRLLSAVLPADARNAIVGDLEEVYRRRSRDAGRVRAQGWYWREAAAFSLCFSAERLRDRVSPVRAIGGAQTPGRQQMGGMRTMLGDIRDSIRAFARRPLLTAAVLASLAFGIGANAAIFSVLNALMLRPLPVREPGALFQVLHAGDRGTFESSTYALYEHLARHAKTIGGTFQVDASDARVAVGDDTETLLVQQVTGTFFDVLGVRPHLGVLIQASDERAGVPSRVAVLSHRYWVRRFGSDPGVLGRTVRIDRVPHTIVGVTPPGFFGLQVGRHADVTIPLDAAEERLFWQSKALVVRLAPGMSRSESLVELNVLFHRYLATDAKLSAQARRQAFRWLDLASATAGLPELRDRYGKPLQAALAIVAALLLLASANLAGLFLARASERRRDLAVCLTLGASRARLARRALGEALLVSLAGGALGVLVAWWGARALVGFLPDLGLSADLDVRPDRNVLLFLWAASLATGVAIGVAPAWLVGRVELNQVLSAGGRTATPGRRGFKALIVAQVLVSTVLVVAAALFTVSLGNLKAQPLGFVADGVLMLTLDADGTDLEGERLGAVHREILRRLEALPGVQAATLATIPPLSGNEDGKRFSIPGVTFTTPDDGVMQVNTVGPGFFATYGVRILKGRGISATDDASSPRVAVVSESMARHYFPGGGEVVGRRIDVGRGPTGGQIEIVGVAEDVRYRDLRTPAPRMVYVPAFQREAEEESVFALRSAADPVGLIAAAQREFKAVVPAIPPTDVTTLVRQRDRRLVTERLLAMVSICFGGLALILVSLGVYGVVAYTVSQRTSEFGVRMALGADRASLLWLVIRETLVLLVAAAGLGAVAAFLASSVIATLLFGVQPAAAWVYSTTIVLLIGIGVLAAAGPTIRAMRADPIRSLRLQ
jgi:predicted permease